MGLINLAKGFGSIFSIGLVRFLMELFIEKPVESEV